MDPAARIAAWLACYRGDLRDALQAARRDDFTAVAAPTHRSDLDPRDFSRTARRHLASHLRGLGLRLGQLCLELPGRGLADPARADEGFDRLRQTLAMARELDVPHAAVTLAGLDDPAARELARDVLEHAAELADHYRVRLSVLDPRDSPEQVAELLDALDCPWLRAGLDLACHPAAPPDAVANRAGDVFVRDVRRTAAGQREVPLGEGEADLPGVIAALTRGDADPLWIIRYDDPARPVDALTRAREHVATLLRGG